MSERKPVPPPKVHKNCLTHTYIRDDNQLRFPVREHQISWSTSYPEYDPDDFTMPHILKGLKGPAWADPNIRLDDVDIKFNAIDGKNDRRSHHGKYGIDEEGSPINPCGRTGLRGRGTLGKWGPNHAADPVVTRWKREKKKPNVIVRDPKSGKPVLQFVAIVRRDHGDWAIPGGMVDAGESLSVTLKREFGEEALNSMEVAESQRELIKDQIDKTFTNGIEVYRGYVDDPRNTDNSWMETQVQNFHDEDGKSVGAFRLHAGDDATGVKWTDIDRNLKLFASHTDFLRRVAEIHNAHW